MRANQHARLTGSDIMDYLEETLVLIKPDALEPRLVGEIIGRFEAAGFRILHLRWALLTPELIESHYTELKTNNPQAFDRNKRYLAGKRAIALVLAGVNAVAKARLLIGPTEPAAAAPGTIRGDLSSDSIVLADSQDRGLHNLVHAADSVDSAKREIALWFGYRIDDG